MIKLHRLNAEEFLVNCDLIEFVEETPNTVVSMISGRKLVVEEPSSEIVRMVIDYKRKIYCAEGITAEDN